MLLDVEHVTRYRYDSAVSLAYHLAYLRPRDDGTQRLLRHELQISPEPMHRTDSSDWLGNARCCFSVDQPHRTLEVRSRSRVRVDAPPTLEAADSQAWEAVRERLRYAAGRAFEPANEFVHASPYVPKLAALADWASDDFAPGRPVAELGLALMARVHREFVYRSASTEVDTPLAEVLQRREGVCQDFAHLLIGALRSRGLAARYVSGYLLTTSPDPGARAPWLGADASHAWVALWCPRADGAGASWLELDPTNDVVPTTGHVRLALGRDYGDVTPLRGVIRSGGAHRLEVQVRTEPVSA
jgi:transglutaminase-like putative cysteine protease